MKEYFKFNLRAEKLILLWLLFMALVVVPYVYIVLNSIGISSSTTPSTVFFSSGLYGVAFLLMILIAYALIYFFIKMGIEGVEYKEQSLVFGGSFAEFIGKYILGFILTCITLGIYAPWFVAKMQRFFVNNTSHNSDQMKFEGKGGNLFVILLLTLFIPIVVLVVIMGLLHMNDASRAFGTGLISNLIFYVVLIPYMYYVYKWMVNVTFRGYSITWHTDFWNSCGKILLEILLTMITLGIYYPLAYLRLYKYFAECTVAVSETQKKKFGYDIEAGADFLFVWGQILLSIITLGIYSPWAGVKITKRILGKTYSEAIEE